MSGATHPMSTPSQPWLRAPLITPAAISGDDGRMSRPTTMRFAPRYSTKAQPMRRASSPSIWPGVRPRTSYALNTAGSMVFTVSSSGSAREISELGALAQHRAGPGAGPPADGDAAADQRAVEHRALADARSLPEYRVPHLRVRLHADVSREHGAGSHAGAGAHDALGPDVERRAQRGALFHPGRGVHVPAAAREGGGRDRGGA